MNDYTCPEIWQLVTLYDHDVETARLQLANVCLCGAMIHPYLLSSMDMNLSQ